MSNCGFDIEKIAKISALHFDEKTLAECDEQIKTFLDYASIIDSFNDNQDFETETSCCLLRQDEVVSKECDLPTSYVTFLPECEEAEKEQVIPIYEGDYKIKVGLEIHAQLTTKSKMFCSCANDTNASPNANTCPICLAHPGCLPTVNQSAVKMAILAGKALHCNIHSYSRFDRKNYFYPDMCKSYQVTQYYKPICTGGYLECLLDGQKKSFALNRIHIEEDAGKLIHLDATNRHGATASNIDYNRAGVPLIEIVTEPVFTNGNEASEFVKMLRVLLINLNICKGNLEDGNMRVDANVSVTIDGKTSNKTEIKNLNSFRAISNGIKYEASRIAYLMNSGTDVPSQTRLWDEKLGATFAMRSKETLADYRYFPEPDLPPLILSDDFINSISPCCLSPVEYIASNMTTYNLDENQSRILVFNTTYQQFYSHCDQLLQTETEKALLTKWFFNELLQYCDNNIPSEISYTDYANLIKQIAHNEISALNGKGILKQALQNHKSIKTILDNSDLGQINDRNTLTEIIQTVISENSHCVTLYHNGESKMYGFLVGQVMKKTNRRANVQIVQEIMQEYLDKKD